MYNAFFTLIWRYILKGTVLYDVKDGIAILTVDNPPVNPLSDGVRTGYLNL